MSDDEIAQRMARTTDFLKRLDTNGNGVIDADEASDPQAKGMLERLFSRMGKEPHFPMAISEIMQGYEAYYRSRGSNGGGPSTSSFGGSPQGGPSPAAASSPPGMGFGSLAPPASGSYSNSSASKPAVSGVSGPAAATLTVAPPPSPAVPSPASATAPAASLSGSPSPAASSPAAPAPTEAKPAPRKPGRFLTARERLPKGLPDWFLEKDVNGEGQVTMAQFTDNWTPDKIAEFAHYDLNHDGIITAAECLKVEKAKAK